MIFTQYYLGCLSQASYLIGDERTGMAVVVGQALMATGDAGMIARAATNYSASADGYAEFWSPVILSAGTTTARSAAVGSRQPDPGRRHGDGRAHP